MSVHPKLRILVLGASYGVLFAVRAALGAHHVTVVCQPDEAEALNANGPIVNVAARKTGGQVQISRQTASLDIGATTPETVDPIFYDLVVLAMQEPQFLDPQIADLALRIAHSARPVVSIMNMAVPPYLNRLKGVWTDDLSGFYHAPNVWSAFSAADFTHSSPEPQAVRRDPRQSNVIDVTLASNFKIAPFAQPKHNEILRVLCQTANMAPMLYDAAIKPRVQLLASRSEFVPMAKWPMLVTGNYRCVTTGQPLTIAEAVSKDPKTSRALYDTTQHLCAALGADARMLVPFAAYAKAAGQLNAPSSVAKALAQGRGRIERMDKLIQALLRSRGIPSPDLDVVVETVDAHTA